MMGPFTLSSRVRKRGESRQGMAANLARFGGFALLIWGLAIVWSALPLAVAAGEKAASQPVVVDSVVLTIARQAEIPARENGLLTELRVCEGQRVKAGELLAQLDDELARLAVRRATLDLERSRQRAGNDTQVRLASKELEIAQAELRRAAQAADRLQRSVTAAELDHLKLEADRAALHYEQAQFELNEARMVVRVQENELQLAEEKARRRSIVSPIDGTVVQVYKRLGEWLEAGQVVVRVIATDQLRAEGFLDAATLAKGPVAVGCPVRLKVGHSADEDESFSGRMVFVSPEVDPVNGQARFWAEIENRGGSLRPGMSGQLTILPLDK